MPSHSEALGGHLGHSAAPGNNSGDSGVQVAFWNILKPPGSVLGHFGNLGSFLRYSGARPGLPQAPGGFLVYSGAPGSFLGHSATHNSLLGYSESPGGFLGHSRAPGALLEWTHQIKPQAIKLHPGASNQDSACQITPRALKSSPRPNIINNIVLRTILASLNGSVT